MKKNIILLLISTAVVLVICEVLIRIIIPQMNDHDTMFQFEENMGWEFIPSKKGTIVYEGGINHTIQVNQEGYRDTSFKEKTKTTKIMVLGDSFVSNISVEDEEVFTRLMEDQLTDTSVYNLGVNGYGQVQEYMVLEKWLPKIQPDLVVVMIYLRNDFTDNMGKFSWLYPRPTVTFDIEVPMQISPPSLANFETKKELPFYYKSHLFLFVKKSIDNIKAKTAKEKDASYTPPEIHTCRIDLSEDTKVMYETMQKLMLEINQYGKRNQTPIVFALAPSMFQVEDDLWSQIEEYYPSVRFQKDMPNATLSAFAKANDLEIIDVMPALQNADRNGVKMYNSQEQHWTVEGNKVVAGLLSNYLKQRVTTKQDSL